jgi:hypothetical protein
MSSSITQPDANGNPLNTFTVQAWKHNIINKALELNTYNILVGDEAKPPNASMAERIKLQANYNEHCSKIVGYIRSTLDAIQTDTVLANIDIFNAKRIWTTFLNAYEPKSAFTCVAILQELVSFRKGSEEYENKLFQQYGSRAIALSQSPHCSPPQRSHIYH